MDFSATDKVVEELREFIDKLNGESENGSIIVVEGKRDAEALSKIGFAGNPVVFHHGKGIVDFVDTHDRSGKKIILLLDMDKTGKHLTRRIMSQLQSKQKNVSLFYKHELAKITNGKVRHIEDLSAYAPLVTMGGGWRKDLCFYT